jgi:cellulose synthase/poly-beta-1,6-N-acetylglucosamine synthase-like glycosyltransferase
VPPHPSTPRLPCSAADRRWSWTQHVGVLLLVGVPLGLSVTAPLAGLEVISWLLTIFFAMVVLLKSTSLLTGFAGRHRMPVDTPIEPAAWPRYTVLVPLHREPEIARQLLTALGELDYPRDRLEILILLEADDLITRAAFEAQADLLAHAQAQLVLVPPGEPRTKPRACNVGLLRATGELVVVYDAEDRPEPDQLRKAAAAFAQLPDDTICLQAKLNYYNWRHNWLARLFTLEYTAWFDLYLPGLYALGLPIPLGGTSNHFRTAALRELGGWDAHNVTEDCELGVRLARAGKATRILDSTTWEEACCALGPWLRQRSRWVKGYLQTFFAHTRDVDALVRDLGRWRTLGMCLTVGGLAFSLLLLVPSLVVLAWWMTASLTDPLWVPGPWLRGASAGMAVFVLAFVASHVVGVRQRQLHGTAAFGLLLPVYWLLMSLGAWRGLVHFFARPFHWDKTPHGLSPEPSSQQLGP